MPHDSYSLHGKEDMFELRCTVRKCRQVLHLDGSALKCQAGHSFDRAKQGYWSLLQPQDRKSSNPGDCDDAVLARHRWLARGHADGLVEALRPWVDRTCSGDTSRWTRTIDLGCGDGSLAPRLFADEVHGYCGIDLSRRGIKLAARAWPNATWVLANADRTLPVADASIDRAVSLFGRRPAAEIKRVLVAGGHCLVAVPGEEDLIQLREHVQQAGHRRSRWQIIVDEMSEAGLQCIEQQTWTQQVELSPAEIADALAMTYRAARYSQHSRAVELPAMRVTLSADMILFVNKAT